MRKRPALPSPPSAAERDAILFRLIREAERRLGQRVLDLEARLFARKATVSDGRTVPTTAEEHADAFANGWLRGWVKRNSFFTEEVDIQAAIEAAYQEYRAEPNA